MIKEGDAVFYTRVKVYTGDEILDTKIMISWFTGPYSRIVKMSICKFRAVLHENTYKLNTNSYD